MAEPPPIDSRQYILAFELLSPADCPPDFEVPPYFDTALFLPRDDPDWFGRSSYPPRILFLKDRALHVVSHPSAAEPPCRWDLAQIATVESAHMLLKGRLRFTGSGFDYTIRYNTRGLPSVLRFMRRLRDDLLPAVHTPATPPAHFGAALDLKFANALARELDPAESVRMQFFQPPREVRAASWLLPRRRWVAGDLLVLTNRRLLWITDRDRGSYSRYGTIASYVPLRVVRSTNLAPGPSGTILQVSLDQSAAWQFPVAEDFAAALYGANFMSVSMRSTENLI